MKRIKQFSVFLLLILITLAACSANDSSYEPSSTRMYSGDSDSMVEESFDGAESDMAQTGDISPIEGGFEVDLTEHERQMIYRAYVELTTRAFSEAEQLIESAANERQGYILNKDLNVFSENDRALYYTIRIPIADLNSFLEALRSDIFRVENQSLTGEDVTDQYVDLETRLTTREQLETRLLEFMENAETTEDLLNISRDLSNVQYEIEQIRGQLQYLDNRIDYATVDISLYEERLSTITDEELAIWERIKDQWTVSTDGVIRFLSNAIVFFVGNLPVLALFFAIVFVLAFIVRRRYKKTAQKPQDFDQ